MSRLILASTSVYRQQLLSKLCIPFEAKAPVCDETPLTGESAEQLVLRLALAKAQSIAAEQPNDCIIGSDQVASFNGQDIIGKPGSHQAAREQLLAASGHELCFYTGTAVVQGLEQQVWLSTYRVYFRHLSEQQIERYLEIEKPYNCAGSFKSEGLGVMLFDKQQGDDPNSLIGLPLIKLYQVLEGRGFQASL